MNIFHVWKRIIEKDIMESESSYDYDSIRYYYIVESLFIF